MLENVAIRILVAIVIIVAGFMVLKFLSAEKEKPVVEYRAPANRKMQIRTKLNLPNMPKSILKKTGYSHSNAHVSFAPSATDATMSEYGAWDTNRNSSSGIMNNLNSVDALTSGQMVPPMTTPPMQNVNALSAIPLIDGYSGDDDMFGSEL
jgi:hypothetical protein